MKDFGQHGSESFAPSLFSCCKMASCRLTKPCGKNWHCFEFLLGPNDKIVIDFENIVLLKIKFFKDETYFFSKPC